MSILINYYRSTLSGLKKCKKNIEKEKIARSEALQHCSIKPNPIAPHPTKVNLPLKFTAQKL